LQIFSAATLPQITEIGQQLTN